MIEAQSRLGRRTVLLTGLAASLGACQSILPGSGEPAQLYTLTPSRDAFPANLPAVNWQLIVEPPVASQGLDNARVALQRSALSIDYYARVQWSNPAPLMIQTLLIESFDNSGKIVGVTRESTQLRADYILQSDLREFQAEHDTPNGPPVAHVKISTKMVRLSDRTIIANGNFEDIERATRGDIDQVVAAFNAALGRVLFQIVEWTLRAPQTSQRPNTP
jgi:cholesterol transport system auxiliary component